jgi:hypothetical protein
MGSIRNAPRQEPPNLKGKSPVSEIQKRVNCGNSRARAWALDESPRCGDSNGMGQNPGQTLVVAAQKGAKASEIIASLGRLVTADDIASAIHGALKAEVTTWETGEDGKKIPTKGPDHKLRLEAGKVALSYLVGMPVQRQEIITKEVKSDKEAMDALLASPAARDALRKKLDEAESRGKIKVVEG